MRYTFGWNIYFVSIDAGVQVAVILLTFGPRVVVVHSWDRFCTLGRAPRTKETLCNTPKYTITVYNMFRV